MHRLVKRQRVWVDFYETSLSETVLDAFIQSMVRLQDKLVKLAIVGLGGKDQRRLGRQMKLLEIRVALPIRFFSDPEGAKTWLVSAGR